MGVVRRTISKYAAPMRRAPTDAEQALWLALRGRRLAGLKFRRQWTLGPFIADFCCLEQRLIVEADGGQHDEAADAARTAWLEHKRFRVLRFWNHDVLGNLEGVLQAILETLTQQDPHPNPLPRAGEGEIESAAATPSPACGRGLG
ncbi:endonuclease domain-containing protein [Sphingosinicella sp.]|uniref:endonuclease domain-containing protein n=1 Tax=Sphingosinicella sp. TaxID=1917971 RepID=UPI004037990E